jgi:putative IMPACT (imprinted ancient) family translation regulator
MRICKCIAIQKIEKSKYIAVLNSVANVQKAMDFLKSLAVDDCLSCDFGTSHSGLGGFRFQGVKILCAKIDCYPIFKFLGGT